MKKAAIFDLDGTIAETVESIAYCTNLALKDFGLPPIETEKFLKIVGDGVNTQFHRVMGLIGDFEEEKIQEVIKRYMVIFEKDCNYHVVPSAGVPELITELKKRGVKCAVCSNKPHLMTLKVVNTAYPEGTFDYILGQSDRFPKKPAPEMPHFVAKELGVEPEECLYLGDTNTDMQTGKGAGMFTIGVLWGFRDRQELEENHADVIIGRPEEALLYL